MMITKNKGRTESAQPQKNSHRNSTANKALSQLPILIDLNVKAHGDKATYSQLIADLRKTGFIRRQIEAAIDKYVADGNGFFVIHQFMGCEYVGMYAYSHLRQRLEIWRNYEVAK
ncbi:hypothetical protein GBK02_15415 [Dechloromonas sp. TW-R-39-2]|uniref:hypothetical protein n=1 Tax=Dechloromonas sp. TW-R-39-2 TaxID=2654218 RepID=UPI00193DB7C7|nr:hypothetical protein [Dechloromonas sp. TW-R-39-2]QRM20669.1 hypothetical protein GBK02_15415 [Dechloromonas sp. TW-R-39-2]